MQLFLGALQLFVGVERLLRGVLGCRQLQLQLASRLATACVRRLRLFEGLLILFDFDLEQTFVESEARNTFLEFCDLLFRFRELVQLGLRLLLVVLKRQLVVKNE